ncbi:hypothetical protein F5B21DRAFT_529373 [Xylaria acuta]|nr:hypothetical protein F5B21DRAFT_529373 [Xylaria acuta]
MLCNPIEARGSDKNRKRGSGHIGPLLEISDLAAIYDSDLCSSRAALEPSGTAMRSSSTTVSGHTMHIEGPESTSKSDPPSPVYQAEAFIQGRLPMNESLGRTELITILGGAILILGSIAFLSLLWFGYGDEPEAADAPWIWRQIVLHDWMTRAITILSLVLRFIVSLQVALCTSMTAALVLEKRSARKSDVAYLSIARSISDGPRRVVQLLFSSRSLSVLSYLELWLISLLALVMLALQFSSTLLLSDLHDYVVVGDVESRSIANFGAFDSFNDSGMDYINWGSDRNTPTYAIFGEEASSYNVTPTASGFSDTGIIRRGYLPFKGSQNRTSVRKYRGSTLVTNFRTVCVPPQIEGQFRTKEEPFQYLGVGHIVGTVNYGQSIRRALEGIGPLCNSKGCESVPFDCSVPGSEFNNTAQSNLCFIETVGRTTQSILDLAPRQWLEYINLEGEPWSINSTMYLVFRSSLTILDWGEAMDKFPIPPANVTGEWNRFEIVNGQFVDISLCFSRFYIQPRYVNMIAQKPTHEPVVMWDGVTLEHDTAAVAASVSADSPLKPPSTRGLMDMDILRELDLSTASINTPEGLSAAILQRTVMIVVANNLFPDSISGCIFCSDYSIPTSSEFALLFTDIVESTGRAAAAVHSYIALNAATTYDELLKVFDISEVIEIAAIASVRTPGPCSRYRCSGFISVTTLLGAHLVIVAAITALYVSQVRYSRLSNTWHAISQLMGEELEDVLNKSNNAKDKSITEALKCDGRDDFVRLGLTSGSTRVQVLKYTKVGQKPVNLIYVAEMSLTTRA